MSRNNYLIYFKYGNQNYKLKCTPKSYVISCFLVICIVILKVYVNNLFYVDS